ncbi:FixH family protein [Sphingorhabdus sp.]|uniref:FixH family protein n=1 Tax=Sphingorhabdus sp. TaxID=1902408 RepID=UPI003BAE774B
MSQTTPEQTGRKPFTGYHMAAILIGFFGIVIAVNVFMARQAISTFGGTVVDNSYVASQNYNEWLAASRAQDKLGWTITAKRTAGGKVALTIKDKGEAGAGFTVEAVAQHPLGRAPERKLAFVPLGNGEWQSTQALPATRWTLRLTLRRGADSYKAVTDLP